MLGHVPRKHGGGGQGQRASSHRVGLRLRKLFQRPQARVDISEAKLMEIAGDTDFKNTDLTVFELALNDLKWIKSSNMILSILHDHGHLSRPVVFSALFILAKWNVYVKAEDERFLFMSWEGWDWKISWLFIWVEVVKPNRALLMSSSIRLFWESSWPGTPFCSEAILSLSLFFQTGFPLHKAPAPWSVWDCHSLFYF